MWPKKSNEFSISTVMIEWVNLKGFLVAGFNPIEKYESNWTISSGRGEIKTI